MKLDNEVQKTWLLHVIDSYRLEGTLTEVQEKINNLQVLKHMVSSATVEEEVKQEETVVQPEVEVL